MRRNSSRYPRTSYGRGGSSRASSYSTRGGMSRRAVLGAAVVVAGAGIADLFRSTGSKASPVADSGPKTSPSRSAPGNGTSGSGKHTTNQPSGAQGATAHHPLHHGNGDSPPPHHHGEVHTEGKHAAAHTRKEDHVTLPPPTVRVRSRPIYSLHDLGQHEPHRAIALTIDDGPDPDWTPKVLRLLDKHRMQASFCVVGIHADSYPKLIRDIHKAGHVIVNHSYTHVQPFARQTEKRIVAEITRTQRAIEKAAKVTPELFRSPGGDWSHFVYRAIASYGLTPLDWDVDPEDWARPGRRKIQHAMLRGRPGDIVLCHDGGGDRSETVRALRHVLPTWKHRHYTTVPLVVPHHAKNGKHTKHSAPPRTPMSAPTITPSGSTSSTTTP
jgi:peptidoglycan/xylan/chitin deacetylase (PgdA/CDA1 family)